MKKTSNTAERLQQIMKMRGLKQIDILEKSKLYSEDSGIFLNKNDLSQYVSGKVEPGQNKIYILSKTLNVDPAWLMGFDYKQEEIGFDVSVNSIPIIGTIAAGTPILADENIESRFNLDASIHADFGLKIRGDSMIEAGIYDGDIVFIRQQPDVENGEIAAVLIDDSATLKKVYKNNGTLVLQAANSKYQPMIFNSGEIHILGKLAAILNIKN